MPHEIMSDIRRLANRLATAADTPSDVRAAALLVETAALIGWQLALGQAAAGAGSTSDAAEVLGEIARREGLDVLPSVVDDGADPDGPVGSVTVDARGMPLVERLAIAREVLLGSAATATNSSVRLGVTERRNRLVQLIHQAAQPFGDVPDQHRDVYVVFIADLVQAMAGERPPESVTATALACVAANTRKWPALAELCGAVGMGVEDHDVLRRGYTPSRGRRE